MKIVFKMDGGIGKSIMATAVCKAIKVQYPDSKIIVITGYPEVFEGNRKIYKVIRHNELNYFYRDHIEGQEDTKFFFHEPYVATDFIHRRGHLIKVWCEMNGIAYNGELPELFLNHKEKTSYSTMFQSPKPIFVIQTNGGMPNQTDKYSWPRDLPYGTAQNIVNAFLPTHNVVQIKRKDQPGLQNVYPVETGFRQLAVLIAMSDKRLFIDSFAQHTAAALGLPSVVCWIANVPSQFGYEMHSNIMANAPTLEPELRNAVLSKYNTNGPETEFPYNNEDEIFDAEKIYRSLTGNNAGAGHQSANGSATVREHITNGRNGQNSQNMVARRLSHLNGKADLSKVTKILDIGSWHLGQSIEFANIFPDAQIEAFEPVPDSYKLCKERLDKLDKQQKNRIKVHNLALADKNGTVPFYAVAPNTNRKIDPGFSSLFPFSDGLRDSYYGDDNLAQQEIKVEASTLDNWCKKNKVNAIDIMWIDVQGAELLVFNGAKNILKNTKIIMTEVGLKPYYKGHTLKADIDKLLSGLGFKEVEGAFELNGFDFEANTIYLKQ